MNSPSTMQSSGHNSSCYQTSPTQRSWAWTWWWWWMMICAPGFRKEMVKLLIAHLKPVARNCWHRSELTATLLTLAQQETSDRGGAELGAVWMNLSRIGEVVHFLTKPRRRYHQMKNLNITCTTSLQPHDPGEHVRSGLWSSNDPLSSSTKYVIMMTDSTGTVSQSHNSWELFLVRVGCNSLINKV